MNKLFRLWRVIILDALGVACMVLALLTGWLPGPGGIPLFLLGLGLLAVNHTWAQRYVDMLKKFADNMGDYIFVDKPWVQLTYDIVSPVVIVFGFVLIFRHTAWWLVSVGLGCIFAGVTFLLGNRGRWNKIRSKLKRNK